MAADGFHGREGEFVVRLEGLVQVAAAYTETSRDHPKVECGICKDTGKVLIGWIMPKFRGGYDLENAVHPGDKCPSCSRGDA